ncbi:Fe(3+)-dicitrate ABC transporter substrate-binding protein FecB [Marinomonas rhizomae]|uniref:Iron complex transport system substrate-binding protein n=1 Tax=Marinomonas rhizomae TaxID=491948 RepID=A0A366J201_9GAMM|nr:Fe(3+) dicitrate ABC transporter substrate-binding protein [Marinomonas rhizomae]RBP81096.1 iron complex transport system substrate-binding protein [Marinomonas rhizomae]RNF72256.1 Fe(3+)-dicitrate ABC transporter substrate-binding protein FecB [Marinomonas rhizomae]
MKRLLPIILSTLLLSFSLFAQAVSSTENNIKNSVEDSKGTFTLDYIPKRIVVLELSFVDALAAVGVSPVGIADDKDPERILKEIRNEIGDWASVGTRSQPSLETISSLKPDLIIADISRHEGVYADLQKIAPTLILPSRRATYEENLQATAIIGKAIGKNKEMQTRLKKHAQVMANFATQLPEGKEVQFGVARDDALFLHTADSYAGGVIRALGLKNANTGRSDDAYRQTSLEQFLAVNPDYFIVGNYVTPSIVDKWKNEPLWSVLKAAKNHHIYSVNPNTWSRCRGIISAETMGQDLIKVFNANK